MSQEHYDTLVKTRKVPATRETCISPIKGYSAKYDGVLVEFEVAPGTTKALEAIGVRNNAGVVVEKYPNMPEVSKGWNEEKAFFKGEGKKGNKATDKGQINIGLGTGKALEIFNKNIIKFKEVPK
ncbi:hypothetical protein EEL30_12210 [Brevibacillus laterosporus]|uniref:Pre-toxin TG domain-containing protein n=1 Tax=Brevibacillus laterosporus TaxID=1465 RepID=A0A518V7L9_BRELA|nr:hypothetical protein EEL30_12210 [Brevibacillus laterosporus]